MVLIVLIDDLGAYLCDFLPHRIDSRQACDKNCQMKKLIIIIAMAVAVAAHKTKRRNSAIPPLDDYPAFPATRQYQQYQTYRNRPYRQDLSPRPEQLSFRDPSLLRHHSSSKTRSTQTEGPSAKNPSTFFTDGPPFVGRPNDQFPYPRSFSDDYRFADLYDAAVNSYKVPDQRHPNLDFLTQGNHGLDYISVAGVSSFESGPASNGQATTTTAPSSMSPTSGHSPLQQSTVSSTDPAISQLRTSATFEPKMPALKAVHTATMPPVKSDTLADTATTGASTPAAVSTTPATSVTASQFSNSTETPSAITTVANLAVMATESPIVSFERHPLYPIEYQAASHYIPDGFKTKLQQSLLDYLASQIGKGDAKTGEQTFLLNNVLPILFNNSNTSVSSYSLSEESKGLLKNNLQTSLLNYYLLQRQTNRAPPFHESSLSETVNYIPVASLVEPRAKITVPRVPIAALSAVPRPTQTVNYRPATMPRVSGFVAQDSSTGPVLPLGTSLSSSFSSSPANGHVAGIFNDLPAGLSRHTPVSLSQSVPAGLATLNFDQNTQQLDQLRQFGSATSLPYSTGLQLHLDGLPDTDYTLRSANTVPRSVDLDLGKMDLSLPELPRHQLPMFPKPLYTCFAV